jgi:hypothetical protein
MEVPQDMTNIASTPADCKELAENNDFSAADPIRFTLFPDRFAGRTLDTLQKSLLKKLKRGATGGAVTSRKMSKCGRSDGS